MSNTSEINKKTKVRFISNKMYEAVYEFKDKPEEFTRIFNFSLYNTNEENIPSINSDTLLADMYVTMNTGTYNISADSYGGLFYKDFDGIYKVNHTDAFMLWQRDNVDGNGSAHIGGCKVK